MTQDERTGNLRGAIVPGQSIGDIRLLASEAEMPARLGMDYKREQRGPECAVYHARGLSVWVDETTKRVVQVLARQGFEGTLMGRIGVGSTIRELRALGEVYCDDGHCPVYLIRGMEGICFETEDNEPMDEDWPEDDEVIAAISVY